MLTQPEHARTLAPRHRGALRAPCSVSHLRGSGQVEWTLVCSCPYRISNVNILRCLPSEGSLLLVEHLLHMRALLDVHSCSVFWPVHAALPPLHAAAFENANIVVMPTSRPPAATPTSQPPPPPLRMACSSANACAPTAAAAALPLHPSLLSRSLPSSPISLRASTDPAARVSR